jgi:hypothetical protein
MPLHPEEGLEHLPDGLTEAFRRILHPRRLLRKSRSPRAAPRGCGHASADGRSASSAAR